MQLKTQKILIVRLGAIGDVIRTLPALRALRHNLPDAYIAWVVEDRAASLLINHPDLNKVFVAPRKEWQKNPLSIKTLKEIIRLTKELRKENFDLVLDFHGLFKSGLITFLTGVKDRVGYARKFTKEGNFLFTNHHVPLTEHKINRVEKNLLLVKHLRLNIDEHNPIIPISEKDREFVTSTIFSQLTSSPGPKVIMHPGSSSSTPYKRWNFSRFAQLADRIIQKYGGTILFTAGNDEKELVDKIFKQMIESQHVLCQTETLTQLAEVIRQCDLFIGNDTAPMHLAAFVGTPVIALFGPTDPIENAPFGKGKAIVIRKDVSCSPCRTRECPNLLCMDAIAVKDVLEAVDLILYRKGFN
ncbi:MAG TPA: glycosyltransferase family 9 protein [Thermodesulfobacteriota bacterium]|nr:glycosyltransferase family 9 protein [Thermodesulfobacteriota bacterium]